MMSTMNKEQAGAWDLETTSYDPFDDGEEQPAAPATQDGVEEAAAGEGQGDQAQAQTVPQGDSAREALRALLDDMNGQRAILLQILGLCRDQMPVSEVVAAVSELQAHNESVFAPVTLCELLERAGGLVRVDRDGAELPVAQGEGAGDDGDGTASYADSDSDDEVVFEEVEPAEEAYWVTTPEGCDVLAEDDPAARLEELFEQDAYYLPVYREILELLADGPRTKREIDVIAKESPLTQEPRRLGGYFVDRLERVGAIEWVDPWGITELGRTALEDERLYG